MWKIVFENVWDPWVLQFGRWRRAPKLKDSTISRVQRVLQVCVKDKVYECIYYFASLPTTRQTEELRGFSVKALGLLMIQDPNMMFRPTTRDLYSSLLDPNQDSDRLKNQVLHWSFTQFRIVRIIIRIVRVIIRIVRRIIRIVRRIIRIVRRIIRIVRRIIRIVRRIIRIVRRIIRIVRRIIRIVRRIIRIVRRMPFLSEGTFFTIKEFWKCLKLWN